MSVPEKKDEAAKNTSLTVAGIYPTADQKLGSFFDSSNPRTSFSDLDFQHISSALQACDRRSWSLVPRLYTVLRMIRGLQVLDNFINEGITDVWFPFTNSRLPKALGSSMQAQFLDTQQVVFTKGLSLETGGMKVHAHFSTGEKLPFRVHEVLGEGGHGKVHRITSLISQQTYARKEFRRGNTKAIKAEIKSFLIELQILKRLQHHHCIELVASYTDPRHFAIIMSPVAEYNLLEFYTAVALDPTKKLILRRFFGCLADGLAYLHSEKVRHRDIKPQNILVKADRVYLTDFGISLDWANLSRSTTEEDSAKTLIYCAPEVAAYEPRNTSSDIWSLGCVFLEMTTILKGSSLQAMREHLMSTGQDNYRYYKVQETITTWSRILRSQGLDWDNTALDWVSSMLQPKSTDRITAIALSNEIKDFKLYHQICPIIFCGDCCEKKDEQSDAYVSDGEGWNDVDSGSNGDKINTSLGSLVLRDLKLVVAINFGTRYSSVAWSDPRRPGQPVFLDTWPTSDSEIEIVRNQVPSEIRYTHEGLEWGFQIPPLVERHTWFKLGLLEQPKVLKSQSKSPDQLSADFLACIYKHLQYTLQQKYGKQNLRAYSIECCLTVPSIWSQVSKDRLLRASRDAGIDPVVLVPELEAAALFGLNSLNPTSLRENDIVHLCDVRERTTDLASYRVTKLAPIKLQEAAIGTGGMLGWNSVKRAFQQFLISKLGKQAGWDQKVLAEATTYFESRANFTSLSVATEVYNIPTPGMADKPRLGLRRGRFRMNQLEMASIFDSTGYQILDLVKRQIRNTREKVRLLVLVGSFGSSQYLTDHLRAELGHTLDICTLRDSYRAVVHGALMAALGTANRD